MTIYEDVMSNAPIWSPEDEYNWPFWNDEGITVCLWNGDLGYGCDLNYGYWLPLNWYPVPNLPL